MIPAENIQVHEMVRSQRLSTLASGVVDTLGADTTLVKVRRGEHSSTGAKARLYGSDTVSATASGMDFIASAGTALAASGSSWGYLGHKTPRFLGIVLSAASTASGIVGAEAITFDNKVVPPSATLGFTSLKRDPSGS